MKVHNLMEEVIEARINLMYEQLNETKPSWLTCDCEDCRLDALSYTLNRIQPKYIVSGRGFVHSVSFSDKSQVYADIDAIVIEAIRSINTLRRPYHKDPKNPTLPERTPSFNFPVFFGTIFDGSSFEPLSGAKITLKCEDKIADMIDKTWANPIETYPVTKGKYSFWVKPEKANGVGENKQFTFTIEVSQENYTPISYAINVPLVSEEEQRVYINPAYSLKIQDLFLFRNDVE